MQTRKQHPPSPSPPHFDQKIQNFYDEYHGHLIQDLDKTLTYLRRLKGHGSSFIYLAGDSSLDNKFWFHNTCDASNGFQYFLDPPTSRMDISHWVNTLLETRGLGANMACINCAVEESSVGSRACGQLLQHDRFIRDHVTSNDVVVVSVGGNDIALKPAPCTILSIMALMCCTTNSCLEHSACGHPLPCDDCCCGYGAGLFSNCSGCPPGYGYMLHLFGTRIQAYVDSLTSKTRPKKVLVCMIYYPDETSGGSWADTTLAALGYNTNPAKLQILIRKVFNDATRNIKIPGCEVVAVPLFAALNPKDTRDYSQRVEPSATGGKKMAELILQGVIGGQTAVDNYVMAAGVESSVIIRDRVRI